MLITFWRRQLLIQQVETKLEANHISLMTGKDAALSKLTISQLKHLMTSLDNYLIKLGK